jgi:hypothetical protein
MFILAAVEVDMVLSVVVVAGLKREVMWVRRGVKIATVKARTTISVAKVFVEMTAVVVVGVVVDCCCALLVVLLVSGIRRDRNQLHGPRAWFIYTSLVAQLVRGSWRRFYRKCHVFVVALQCYVRIYAVENQAPLTKC